MNEKQRDQRIEGEQRKRLKKKKGGAETDRKRGGRRHRPAKDAQSFSIAFVQLPGNKFLPLCKIIHRPCALANIITAVASERQQFTQAW